METYNGLLIVIPTRNRAELATAAIESVISQSLEDVTILVSDNSTEAAESTALRSACDRYRGNQVHYIRPDAPLSMAEHWDWAMQQAIDTFKINHILYLTDRMVFKTGALARIRDVAQSYPDKIISYGHDHLLDDKEPIRVYQHAWTGHVFEIDSISILKRCSRMYIDMFLPRMLNCLVPRRMMEQLRERFGNYFTSISPDFNFCFKTLLMVDSVIFMDQSLLIHYALLRSNGASTVRGVPNKDNEDFVKTSSSGTLVLSYAPIPEIASVGNAIIYEYCLIQRESCSPRFPPVEMDRYLTSIGEELAPLQDGTVRAKWEDLLRSHGWQEPTAPRQDGDTAKNGRQSVPLKTPDALSKRINPKMAVRGIVEIAINRASEGALRVIPTRLRPSLAANKWSYRDAKRAMFCARFFERSQEQHLFQQLYNSDGSLTFRILID